MEYKIRIVLVEDNEGLANAIGFRLRDRGHAVDILNDGEEGHEFLKSESADLVILDVNLPRKNGFEILRGLRARSDSVPVLILTARGETNDRVEGLDLGADDYLVKPFEMDELEARIRALSRRRNLSYEPFEKVGALEFDRANRTASANKRTLDIPRRELAILECLLDNKGRIVAKERLFDHVYGTGADVESSAIEPHISRLRSRIGEFGVVIKVARGLGYMIEEA